MDDTAKLETRIGLLVIAGVAALVVLILATDRISWDSNYRVRVFMDDAGGLNVGSPVKLAGITVGSVTSIRPSEDERGQIEATVSISGEYTIDRSSVITNQPSGIFGDNVLSISAPTGRIPDPLPKDDGPEAAMVASSTFLDQATLKAESILAGLAELMSDESVAEIRETIGNTAAMTASGQRLLDDLDAQVAQLGTALASLEELAKGLESSRGKLTTRAETTADELDETLVALRTASRDISEQVDRLASRAEVLIASSDVLVRGGNQLLADSGHDLRATIADLRRTAASLAEVSRGVAHGRGVVGQLLTSDAMARDVNDTVITAAQLTERVADQPEVLFWGTTNEERDQAAREREARQIRRAFMEGFEYREEPVRREEPRVREEEARGDEEGE